MDRMQAVEMRPAQELKKGQLWKMQDNYIYIVDSGKRLIHYKMMRHPNQRAVITRLVGIPALSKFLEKNQALLVE
jgi:hypothetical protein